MGTFEYTSNSDSDDFTNNPSVWAPLSISNSNDFISNPSVLAAAMSGTSIEDAVQYEVPKFAASPSIIPPPSRRDKDTVSTKTRSDELKDDEEVVQSKKQIVATSKEFVPQKNEVVVPSSKLSPTAPSFDYSSVPLPPPLPTPQICQSSSFNITLPNLAQHCIRGDAAGIYQQASTLHDETNMYFKEGIWDGRPVTFVVFRTSLAYRPMPTKKYWLLGIAGSIILFNKSKRSGSEKKRYTSWKLFDTTECYNSIGKLYPMLTPQLNTDDKANPCVMPATASSTPLISVSYAHSNSYKKVEVIGCGMSNNINGFYKKSYNRNGITSYIKTDIEWNGTPGNFVLLRDAFYWSIGFQLQKYDGSSIDGASKTFYRTNVSLTKSHMDHPPCDGWITVGTGVELAPT